MVTKTLASALKRVFGNGSVNAIASTSLVPYCNASGEPDGLSSISNLASVLGGEHVFVGSRFNRDNSIPDMPSGYGYLLECAPIGTGPKLWAYFSLNDAGDKWEHLYTRYIDSGGTPMSWTMLV